ncbi:E3 SUMO-protein ligase PIAS3 [Orchesella cincta]|uniref:E3 SUMO-protein ligase PIAS3 n=1 Tax=Orchesella cincta TaxID=48709 RepID=A0A1D2M981_ORCCI|nr:E3 SUMO-protein ligase PIAS3 [Orchesella cincta]
MGSELFGLPADFLLQKLLIKMHYDRESCPSFVDRVMRGDQDVCAATSIRMSLICPLAKTKIAYPCRSVACAHAQCFDAKQFFMLNEIKRMVKCPICNEKITFNDLKIDRYFYKVIAVLIPDEDVTEIELFADGTWEPIQPKQMADPRARLGRIMGKTLTDSAGTTHHYVTPMEKAAQGNTMRAETYDINSPVELIDLTADDDSDIVYID